MKRITHIIVLLFLLTTAAPLAGQPRNRASDRSLPRDGVIVRVNNDVILASEVWKRLGPLLRYKKKRLSSEQFRKKKRQWYRKTISQMIRSRVIQQEAEQAGLTVSDRAIQDALQRQIEQVGSREEFIRGLRQRDWTLERWKRQKRKELLQKKLFRTKFKKSGTTFFVSPEEIKTYYRNHQQQFTREAKVKGHVLGIPYGDARSREEALGLARSIRSQIEDGARMSHLVELYKPLDPDFTKTFDDWIRKGTFGRTVEQILFEKEDIKNVEGPVVLENRVVLLNRTAKIQRKESEFKDPDVQKKIRNLIRNRKYREKLSQIEKRLLENAYINPRYLLQVGS